MEKVIVAVTLLLVLFSLVSAADNWSSFTDDSSSGLYEESVVDEKQDNYEGEKEVIDNKKSSFIISTKFTPQFYIVLSVALIGLLIIIYLIYSFVRKPRNKWEKQKVK